MLGCRSGWLTAPRSYAALHAAAASRAVKSDHQPRWGLYRYPCAPQSGNKANASRGTLSKLSPPRAASIQNAPARMAGSRMAGFGDGWQDQCLQIVPPGTLAGAVSRCRMSPGR